MVPLPMSGSEKVTVFVDVLLCGEVQCLRLGCFCHIFLLARWNKELSTRGDLREIW